VTTVFAALLLAQFTPPFHVERGGDGTLLRPPFVAYEVTDFAANGLVRVWHSTPVQ